LGRLLAVSSTIEQHDDGEAGEYDHDFSTHCVEPFCLEEIFFRRRPILLAHET